MSKLSPSVGFDIDRGDRATRLRELSKELVEWGFNMAAPVLFAFEEYMAGNPGDPIPDITKHTPKGLEPFVIKIMTGKLLSMIEHQKQNAKHAYEKSAKSRESARVRWGRSNANAYGTNANAYDENANAPDIDIEREEDKVKEGLYSSSLSPVKGDTAGNPPGADGAAADARPTAHTSHECMRTATVGEWPEHSAETFDERDLRNRPVQYVLDMGIDEDENKARAFYMKALEELGPDVYAETCWRFVTEYTKAANAYGETMRKLSTNWDAHEDEYKTKGETWESILGKAHEKNWHLMSTNHENYTRYQFGGRILAGMLKEAGLARGINLGAKRPKKGGDE